MPDDSQLPNLIALEVADDIRQLGSSVAISRPLQRIQMTYGTHLSSLSRYSATLTTLNILQTRGTVALTCWGVVRALPALVHFGVSEVRRPASIFLHIALTMATHSPSSLMTIMSWIRSKT
jgi:hypothetical protein